MAEFPKLTPPPAPSPTTGDQVAATVMIEMLANGTFRCHFPDNAVVGMGMLEIAKDIYLTKIKEQSQRLIQPAFGPLPPTRQ